MIRWWIRFTGNRTYPIELNGKTRYPDFVVEPVAKTKKLIDLFGMFHETEEELVLLDFYEKAGYECLVVWQNEFYDYREATLRKVMEYVGVKTWQLQLPYEYVTENRVRKKYRDILKRLQPVLDEKGYVVRRFLPGILQVNLHTAGSILASMCKYGFLKILKKQGYSYIYVPPETTEEDIDWSSVYNAYTKPFHVSQKEKQILSTIVQDQLHPKHLVAEILLLREQNMSVASIGHKLNCKRWKVDDYCKQFTKQRLRYLE